VNNNSVFLNIEDIASSINEENSLSCFAAKDEKTFLPQTPVPVMLLSFALLWNVSNPILTVLENFQQSVPSKIVNFSASTLVETTIARKSVGKKISRREAFAITRRILQEAEQARVDAAEFEAECSIPWDKI
jgi:hypothetical protein